MSNLSSRISGIKRKWTRECLEYDIGHSDAKHEAATMAIKYDLAFSNMFTALSDAEIMLRDFASKADPSWKDVMVAEQYANNAKFALNLARELDEHQKTEGVE